MRTGRPHQVVETARQQYGATFAIVAKAGGWNFCEYLIGRDGHITEVFPETVEPWTRGSSQPSRGRSRRPDVLFSGLS
jgi:glutathione peroxidase-family protein